MPSTYIVSTTARLNAPPRRVYDIIANYHTGHPRIVPKQFSHLTVEAGGVGAGTTISFQMRLLGRTNTFRAVVTEPEPGRVLVEKNILGNDATTTFIVDPGSTTNEAVVTIKTELTVKNGIAGAIERFLTMRLLRPIYDEELKRLEAVAGDQAGTGAQGTA